MVIMNIGCVSGYNESQFIEKTLEALKSVVDKVIYIDGAYKSFPTKDFKSNDGSIDIARDIADVVVVPTAFWLDEVTKRNYYLRYLNEDDYCLVVDGDEEVSGTLNGITDDNYLIKFNRPTKKLPNIWLFRLFKFYEGMIYRGAHNALWRENTLLNNTSISKLETLRVIHHTDLRPVDRWKAKSSYYTKLRNSEKLFRLNNKLRA